jgi:hypothetical protein
VLGNGEQRSLIYKRVKSHIKDQINTVEKTKERRNEGRKGTREDRNS